MRGAQQGDEGGETIATVSLDDLFETFREPSLQRPRKSSDSSGR
jgi:hypothetical protein